MPDIMSMLTMLLNRHPEVANNPRAKEYIDIIRNNDSKRGKEIANNICKTYNISKEEAMSTAQQFFLNLFKR